MRSLSLLVLLSCVLLVVHATPIQLAHHSAPSPFATPLAEITCADLDSTIFECNSGVHISTQNGLCKSSAKFGFPASCAIPDETFTVTVQMTNSGRAAWNKAKVHLVLSVDGEASEGCTFGGDGASTLRLVNGVQPGQVATFSGQLKAPKTTGRFKLTWTLRSSLPDCPAFGETASAMVEVSCSNGIFCDGVEQYVAGRCVSARVSPCDDGEKCTADSCDEDLQRCYHMPRFDILETGYDCSTEAVCQGESEEVCIRQCEHEVCEGEACSMVPNECGGDGCGGTCGDHEGLCANLEHSCNRDGMCEVNESLGSCAQPHELPIGGDHPDVQALSESFEAVTLDVDTSIESAQFIAAATCNPAATSGQVMAHFSTPAVGETANDVWWIDARISDGIQDLSLLDTVLELREGTCYDPVDKENMVASCNDDASPPGGVGSRVVTQVHAGKEYYFIMGGYNSETVGPATLSVKFLPNQPHCLSRYCGEDAANPGNMCGSCGEGYECDSFRHCILARDSDYCTAPLSTRCGTRVCGDDGCGNSCGSCESGSLCTPFDGQCRTFPVCDHFHPTCSNCKRNQYCGSDCQCRDVNYPLPDIFIDQSAMAASVLYDEVEFDALSCPLVENCVGGSGVRKLLRFDTTTVNQGRAHLKLDNPATRPDQFHYGVCHNHYHYSGYARYQLVKPNGDVVATGHKQGYCMQDSTRYDDLSGQTSPCRPQSFCDNPGISMGWSDTYGNSLDCQWVDITDVDEGDYILEVELNAERRILETTTENNVGTVRVRITDGGAETIPDV